jgi:hypothetical protein
MIFEFINPSDPYHFEAPDLEIAAMVTFILGEGKGAAHQVECDEEKRLEVPIFLFGGLDKWVQDKFGKSVEDFITYVKKDRQQELITSLESVTIGSLSSYHAYHKAIELIDDPEKKKQYQDYYHDQELTSMNDFGTYARSVAKSMKGADKS